MDNDTHLISYITFVAGIFSGLLNNILTSKGKIAQKWQYILYVLGLILLFWGIYALYIDNEKYKILGCVAIIISLIHIIGSYYLLNLFDEIIKTSKLVPRVIEFTENAKSDEIRLWGGDLNFFGNSVLEMEKNEQYNQLKNKRFEKILILCKRPRNNESKKCYGKILNEFTEVVEFKFYNEINSPDLHIRGRIKRKYSPDIFVALVYERVNSNSYKTIEEDITKEGCNMIYVKIWEMSWKHADNLTDTEKHDLLNIFSQP